MSVPTLKGCFSLPSFRILAAVSGITLAGILMANGATFTVTSTNDSGLNTLRWAVTNANITPGTNTIAFGLTGTAPFTINLSSPLLTLTNPVIVDGTTQAGYSNHPQVMLKGNNFGNGTNGLRISAGNSVVRGLAIGGFYAAVRLETNGNNVIQGNYLGTDAYGTNAAGNIESGVAMNSSHNNIIGGAAASERNVIAANNVGIWIFSGSTNNSIINNLVGLKSTGSNILGNATGVLLQGVMGNLVISNVISGNTNNGVDISSSANGNIVQGNLIGTDTSGSIALGNRQNGIAINSGWTNIIGGSTSGQRNVIAGNLAHGIQFTSATSNAIAGNFIGVDATGTNAMGNGLNGILLQSSMGNMIGGASAPARNVISGNTNNGIYVYTGANANFVQGNYIGTDSTGGRQLSNVLTGVRIEAGTNTIGGTIGTTGNLIAGNGSFGVYLTGTNATGNLIEGNLIGTDSSGLAAVPNNSGIVLTNAPKNTVGGTTASSRNIISGNSVNGIRIQGNYSTQNPVLGNYIGTTINGTAGLGNGRDGVVLQDLAANNIIGGTASGAGNLISANGTTGNLSGIYITNVSGTTIQGNYIGTKIDGVSALGNTSHGIEIYMGNSNVIGGTVAGAGNRIAFAPSLRSGVRIRNPVAGGSIGNLISGNLIFSNANLGIDLEPLNANTNTPCNSGTSTNANKGQNYPVLTLAVSDSASVAIKGTLNSTANTSFRIQFFANPSCYSGISGYGQGQIYLGEGVVNTDGSCNASFTATINQPVTPGYVVTATAIDPGNNTSEFSTCIPVSAAPSLTLKALNASPNAQLQAAWPVSPAGFVLKQTTNLAPPVVWSTATNAVIVNGSTNVVTISAGSGSQFFRLSFE